MAHDPLWRACGGSLKVQKPLREMDKAPQVASHADHRRTAGRLSHLQGDIAGDEGAEMVDIPLDPLLRDTRTAGTAGGGNRRDEGYAGGVWGIGMSFSGPIIQTD